MYALEYSKLILHCKGKYFYTPFPPKPHPSNALMPWGITGQGVCNNSFPIIMERPHHQPLFPRLPSASAHPCPSVLDSVCKATAPWLSLQWAGLRPFLLSRAPCPCPWFAKIIIHQAPSSLRGLDDGLLLGMVKWFRASALSQSWVQSSILPFTLLEQVNCYL